MDSVDKARIVEAHEPHAASAWVWVGFLAALALAEVLLAWAVRTQPWWVIAPIVFVVAHSMHGHILAFHEASHRTLAPVRWVNDAIGLFIGTLSFQGLTGFRAIHHSHHAYLGTERDEELWPFVVPTTPRWFRCCVAAFELTFGIMLTPILVLRTFLRRGSPVTNPSDRRRVWLELVLMAAVWSGIVGTVAWFDVWRYFVLMYVVPGVIAGNMHSMRKYIEHMGMTGSTVLSCTRSILASGPLARFVSFTLFNINYHGIHHRYARIPQARLPELTSLLASDRAEESPPYPSYRAAMSEMLLTLSDPRIGAQWLRRACPQVEVICEPCAQPAMNAR
jgi:fatty acid desaturase